MRRTYDFLLERLLDQKTFYRSWEDSQHKYIGGLVSVGGIPVALSCRLEGAHDSERLIHACAHSKCLPFYGHEG